MKFTPHPFQAVGIEHAVKFFAEAQPRDKVLYASPTGTGKSVVELFTQLQSGDGTWIVTPREEIITGMLDKKGVTGDSVEHRIITPIRLRNMLLKGEVPSPDRLIYDEGHHHNAETWQQLDLLTGFAPCAAYTATPYRGSPRGTRELLESWGDPLWLISYREAIDEKYIVMPEFAVLPLVDDDIVEVRGGEFDVTSLDAVTVDRLGDMADHCVQWYDGKWDKATTFAMPSSAACIRLQQELAERGLPSAIVTADTPRSQRQGIFDAVEARIFALIQINIVSEGVDLRLRRLIDMAPTLSPVKWAQQLGRIMRPTDESPEYVCTNRNILRHAYVLEGCVQESSVLQAQQAFPPTERAHSRVLGLEAIGRFKPTTTKLTSGLVLHVYALSVPVGTAVIEYCCLVHPVKDPIWATKANVIQDGVRTYGRWTKCEPPDDLRGFSSLAPKELSDKQRNWWNRQAARYGLDPQQDVTRKSFQPLPVLNDLGERL